MMSKIAIIMNDDWWTITGGAARFVREIAPPLSLSHQIHVVFTRSPDGVKKSRINDNLQLTQFPNYYPFPDVFIPKFSRELIEILEDSELVFLQTPDLLKPLRLARRLKKPVLSYFHAVDWARATNWWGKGTPLAARLIRRYCAFWYNQAQHVGIPSWSMQKFLQEGGIRTPPSQIPLGIDSSIFHPPENKIAAKEALGLEGNVRVIGFIGRIWKDKNIELLVDSFLALRSKGPPVVLLLVGSGDSKYEKKFKDLPGVIRVEQQREVVPYLQAMDVFCMPSLSETSSLATMEAMACQIPVVANAVGCIPEYVRHGENGFLVAPPGDRAKFLECLEKLIQEPGLCAEMGKRARDTVVTQFSWEKTVAKLQEVFSSLLNGSH